jgi:plasmid stabilization system protein ParE
MNYTVVISRRAEHDIYRITAWWAENRSANQASRWLAGIQKKIRTLKADDVVGRCIVCPETAELDCNLLELHFGLGTRPTHRVVFTVNRDLVLVVAVRHLHQDRLTTDDLS